MHSDQLLGNLFASKVHHRSTSHFSNNNTAPSAQLNTFLYVVYLEAGSKVNEIEIDSGTVLLTETLSE